jgi:hypothetical protein
MTDKDDQISQIYRAAPGTHVLYDNGGNNSAVSKDLKLLQHTKKGDGHILLVPQPSLVDPNDPLRWSTVKKWLTFSNTIWYAFNGAVTGPIMAAG